MALALNPRVSYVYAVYDALRRKFQCATVPLDFQLPIRFDLTYQTPDSAFERPVIVHR